MGGQKTPWAGTRLLSCGIWDASYHGSCSVLCAMFSVLWRYVFPSLYAFRFHRGSYQSSSLSLVYYLLDVWCVYPLLSMRVGDASSLDIRQLHPYMEPFMVHVVNNLCLCLSEFTPIFFKILVWQIFCFAFLSIQWVAMVPWEVSLIVNLPFLEASGNGWLIPILVIRQG